MSKKPILVEVYAWNETILGSVAVGWALLYLFYDWPLGELFSRRQVIAALAGSGGVTLLILQSERVRTFLDFRLPSLALKVCPPTWRRRIMRLLPATTIIRLGTHFLYTVWWLLMALIVALVARDITIVRVALYLGFAALHLDRLLRLILWVRQ